MTPLENEVFQYIGTDYLALVAAVSIYGFIYGASSLFKFAV